MKKARYDQGGVEVPIGFLNTDNAVTLAAAGTTAAYGADIVVRVTPVSTDAWIAIGTAPTATASTDGSHLIPVGSSQDFGVSRGDKINSTAVICITPFE